MQPLLFSKAIDVHPTIKFYCTVNGKDLKAKITHTEDDGLQVYYHIVFSDGHSDCYIPGDTGMQEGFGRTRVLDAYEEAIFEDLAVIPGLKNGGQYDCVRVQEIGGGCYNVWIRNRKGFYSVYYKGEYQFTLRRRSQWEVSTMRTNGHIVNQ